MDNERVPMNRPVPETRDTRVAAILLVLCAIQGPGQAQSREPWGPRPFSVAHYDVQLEPGLDSRTIVGTVALSVVLHGDNVDTITLNRGTLEIESVRERGSARSFVVDGSRLRIALPGGRSEQARTLTIAYRGSPRSGLTFVQEREQVYTLFSTSQWTIALDEPDARATLRLRLIIPRDWNAAASGREVSRRALSKDRDLVEWRQDVPVPTYTFGFAAGRFSVVTERVSGVTLRYLANGFSATDVRRVFGESSRMIAFFEERSGMPYPGRTYSQALVARTVGQEMAGLLGDGAFWSGIRRYTKANFGKSVETIRRCGSDPSIPFRNPPPSTDRIRNECGGNTLSHQLGTGQPAPDRAALVPAPASRRNERHHPVGTRRYDIWVLERQSSTAEAGWRRTSGRRSPVASGGTSGSAGQPPARRPSAA